MPVIARVVGVRLTKQKQNEINNGVAAVMEQRLNKRLAKARQQKHKVDDGPAVDLPTIAAAIMDARRSLVRLRWWADLNETSREMLLESSDNLQRGSISSAEWAKLIADAQTIAQEPKAAQNYVKPVSPDWTRSHSGW